MICALKNGQMVQYDAVRKIDGDKEHTAAKSVYIFVRNKIGFVAAHVQADIALLDVFDHSSDPNK